MRPIPEILATCDRIASTLTASSLDSHTLARDVRELLAEVEALRLPRLTRNQPCGCIVCQCDGDQCLGCGSVNCGAHPVGAIPSPVYEHHPLLARAESAEHDRDEALTALQSAHVERDRLRGALEDATREAIAIRGELDRLRMECRSDADERRESAHDLLASAVRTEGAPPHAPVTGGTVNPILPPLPDAEGTVRT